MRATKHKATPERPRLQLDRIAGRVGCRLISVGDVEQLAGVDINSPKERWVLWSQFRYLFDAPSQKLIDAVMDHCSTIAMRRINAGELCLVKTVY